MRAYTASVLKKTNWTVENGGFSEFCIRVDQWMNELQFLLLVFHSFDVIQLRTTVKIHLESIS